MYDLNLYSGMPTNMKNSTVIDGYAKVTIKRGEGYRVAARPHNSAVIHSRRYVRPAGYINSCGSKRPI